VMITKSGVKLLDFGLAKAVAPTTPQQVTSFPTQQALTQEGTILGTFQYMAPEQLEGKEADARTDIFAFGAVLYEMATGKKAFTGTSQASLISSIMSAEPPAVSAVTRMAPPAFDRVTRTCLAKDPEERWQSAADVKRELRWITEPEAPTSAAAAISGRSRARQLAWWLVAVLTLLLFATLPLAIAHLRHPFPAHALRFNLLLPAETIDTGGLAVSPDGRSLAFAAQDDSGNSGLWIRSLETGAMTQLAGTDYARLPFWSPDGRHIAFFSRDKLKKVEAAGGTPSTICGISGNPRGGTWSKGVILFSPAANSPILRVSAEGGSPVAATNLTDRSGAHLWPFFLPDGRRFLFVSVRSRVDPSASSSLAGAGGEVFIGSLEGKEPIKILQIPIAYPVVYAPDGHLLFVRDALVAQALDLDGGRLLGEPVRLSGPLARKLGSMYVTADYLPFSLSGSGILVFGGPGVALGSLKLTWFDRQGNELGRLGSRGAYRDPAFSPDWKRVAGQVSDEMGVGDLWLLDLERNIETRFTFQPAARINPIWSPDGNRIVFASDQPGIRQLFVKRSDGNGPDEQLLKTGRLDVPTDWSPDGQFVVYEERDPAGKRDLWLLPMSGDRKPVPYLKTPFDEFQGQISPDGKWMAFGSDESGRWEIYVQSLPAIGGKFQVSNSGGTQPRWRRDGRELFYLSMEQKITAVDVKLGPQSEFGPPKALFTVRVLQNAIGSDEYVPSRDGQRFLVTNAVTTGQLQQPVTVVLNWTAELTR
jgi:Tol biopolymer transport system component